MSRTKSYPRPAPSTDRGPFETQRLVVYPKAVVVGLLAQLVMLPILGFALASRENPVSFFAQVGLVTLALNLGAMTLGYAIAVTAKPDRPSAAAIKVEVGIQNSTLAIAIASVPMAIPRRFIAC